ncbi:hypothetical protein BG011_005325, partial [Mortierella polycephala]
MVKKGKRQLSESGPEDDFDHDQESEQDQDHTHDQGTSSDAGTPMKRKRLTQACDPCRKKKIKCDGIKPSCANCAKSSINCTYLPSMKKRGPRQGYIELLEKRLDKMEQLLKQGSAAVVDPELLDSKSILGSRLRPGRRRSSTPPVDREESKSRPDPDERYFGTTSGYTSQYTEYDKQNSPNISAVGPKYSSQSTLPHKDRPKNPLYGIKDEVPRKDILDHLIELFFDSIYFQLPIIHPSTFMKQYEEGKISPNLLNAMCAAVARFSNHPDVVTTPAFLAGEPFATNLRGVLVDSIDVPTVSNVQALLLLSMYEYGAARGPRAWMFGGMAVRQAQELGLNREDSSPVFYLKGDWVMRETRRRTFWACFMLDVLASSSSGRPRMMDERDCEVLLPSEDHDWYEARPVVTEMLGDGDSSSGTDGESTEPKIVKGKRDGSAPLDDSVHCKETDTAAESGSQETPHTANDITENDSKNESSDPPVAAKGPGHVLSSFAYLIRIVAVLGKVTQYVNRPRSKKAVQPNEPGSEFSLIDAALTAWHKSIPPHLAYSLENAKMVKDKGEGCIIVFMHVIYHTSVVLLHRPILAAEKSASPMESNFIENSMVRCAEAASKVSDVLEFVQAYHCPPRIFISAFFAYPVFTTATIHITNAFASDPVVAARARRSLSIHVKILQTMKSYWSMADKFFYIIRDLYSIQSKISSSAPNSGVTTPRSAPSANHSLTSKSSANNKNEPLENSESASGTTPQSDGALGDSNDNSEGTSTGKPAKGKLASISSFLKSDSGLIALWRRATEMQVLDEAKQEKRRLSASEEQVKRRPVSLEKRMELHPKDKELQEHRERMNALEIQEINQEFDRRWRSKLDAPTEARYTTADALPSTLQGVSAHEGEVKKSDHIKHESTIPDKRHKTEDLSSSKSSKHAKVARTSRGSKAASQQTFSLDQTTSLPTRENLNQEPSGEQQSTHSSTTYRHSLVPQPQELQQHESYIMRPMQIRPISGPSSTGSGISSSIASASEPVPVPSIAVGDMNQHLLNIYARQHQQQEAQSSSLNMLQNATIQRQQQQLDQQHQQQQQQQQQQQSQQHVSQHSFSDQGFSTVAQMDTNSSEATKSSFVNAPMLFPSQQPQVQVMQHQQQHHPFTFSQDHTPSFEHTFHQQQPQHSTALEDDALLQHHSFGHARPMSLSGMNQQQQQQQFEDLMFQQQQQLSSDMKGHFRHASSPNLSEMIKQEGALQQRTRVQQQQMQLHHQQESLQLSQQQKQQQHHQQHHQQQSVHPFSAAPGMTGKPSIAPARTLTKRPSDLHVDISGRSSSFRLSGDVRNGDFRFGNEGRDAIDSVSAPLSPTAAGNMTAPLTPAFFSPAFAEALGSPGSILYQNNPFVLNSHERSRSSVQTDTSMGSFMDLHASSASSPSSLGSLSDMGSRMFRASTDSMHAPVETVTPMDIACNFNDMSADMSFLDKPELRSVTSSSSLQHPSSFCHSPDHIDPHSVEVKPSYFSATYQEDNQPIKIEMVSTPELDHIHDNSRSVFRDSSLTAARITPTTGSVTPLLQPKTARKRRSNEAVSCSPAVSSPSNSNSPPRPARSRTISTSSSLMDEKEERMDSPGPASHGLTTSLKPIMLTHDLKPPSSKVMRTIIKQFLSAKTPGHGGEKSVLILTSKVAQKSYGTEKRFLCPPPTTMLLGSNWWSAPLHRSISEDAPAPAPPKMIVSICGEAGSQQGMIDWTTSKDDGVAPIVTGKCVSKQLYINDADEKRKKVEVLVKFMMAGDMELGTFASKPIKVISKPSKKRQSIKNMELCIHHGTTISLFNRIRSQTVSTKYLGVSTTTQASAHAPWNYGNNNLRDWPNLEPSPESSANPVNTDGGTCFVARTGGWDPFVVWIVSPGQTRTETLQEHSQRHPGFPPPPAIAINSPPENIPQTPIHYNQPIVLQCLSTGLVSPVMVIRKVDKGSMVLGGGSSGHASAEYDQEAIGDPVSQLHKVAFQITGQSPPTAPFSSAKLQQGTYLACLGDVVGMQRANEGKRYLPDPKARAHSPTSSDAAVAAGSPFAMDIVPEMPENNGLETHKPDWNANSGEKAVVVTADGQKVERKRRVSSSALIKSSSLAAVGNGSASAKAAAAKARRRVNSMSVTQAEAQRIRAHALANNHQYVNSALPPYGNTSGASQSNGIEPKEKASKENAKGMVNQQQRRNTSVWTEDVTDAAVWTIVGTDCAQYNFCTPGGSEAMSLPRSPLTPVPKVMEICLNGQATGFHASAGPILINSISNSSSTGLGSHGNSKGHGSNKALRVMEPN